MVRYTFLTIEKEDVMDIPGEIVETYTNNPHSREKFAALVKLGESDSVQSDDAEDSSPVINYEEIDGVGNATAKNLVVAGYETEDDVAGTSVEELSEVDGVGNTTAENIINYVG